MNNGIKIKVFGTESEEFMIESIIPFIPRVGESLGFYVDKKDDREWVVAEIVGIVYEFTELENFYCVEITVKY